MSGRVRAAGVVARRVVWTLCVVTAVPVAGLIGGRPGLRWMARRLNGTGGSR